jgi:acetoin utilization protein AcuB
MPSQCPECGVALPQGTPAWTRQLTVADVMTKDPVTIGPEESLARGMEIMRMRGIRRIPIVMGDQLLGLLAEGDLKRAQPSILDSTPEAFQRVMDETTVSRIMISNPVTITEDTPLAEAAHTLHSTKFGALPVMRNGRMIGILTDSDLIRALADLLTQAG